MQESLQMVDSQRLGAELQHALQCEVRFDDGMRAAYAADASNYRQVPIGVVLPRSVEDVVGAMRICAQHNVPVLARGGATSLNGQTVNVAVGTPAYPTPKGTYKIRKLVCNPAWIPPDSPWAKNKTAKGPGAPGNPMKVVKIFFKEPDYYIHGTGDEDALGGAASHGCIRMSQRDAFALGRYLMDHGGAAKSDDWYDSVFSKGVSADIRLPKYVTIVIGP
jgi:lipoprotein-anchoring transpeptidase ErfK/SrfK